MTWLLFIYHKKCHRRNCDTSIILYIFLHSLRRLGDNTFDELSCDKISAISESESPVYLVLLKSKSLLFEFSGHPIM